MKRIYNEVGTLVVAPKFKLHDWVYYITTCAGCISVNSGHIHGMDVFVSIETDIKGRQGEDRVLYYIDNDIVEEAGCYASRDEVISALLQLVESIRSEDCQ